MKSIVYFFVLFFTLSLQANPTRQAYDYEKKKDYSNALKIFERLCSENSHNYVYHIKAAWLSYMAGRLGKSVGYYSKAIVMEPDAIEPRLGQIKPLLALGKYKQAMTTAKTVLRLDSKNFIARSKIAYSLYLSGQYPGAEKYYQGLVHDYPTNTEMLIGLGWTYLKRGKRKSAREILEKAEQIAPENQRVISGLKLLGR